MISNLYTTRSLLLIKATLLGFIILGSQSLWASSANELPSSPSQYIKILNDLGETEAASEFAKAVGFEQKHQPVKSIEILNNLHEKFPEAPYIMWRLSRNYWVYAESLDIDDKENRLKYFGLGKDIAIKGIEANKNCAECYLFKFGNMGRIGTTKGLLNSISIAKELSQTIAKSIELQPNHQDTPYNTSLGNAYYASGVFYRIVPDSIFIKWIAGVRGDKMKALEHIKKAAEITPARVDYQVELGAIYLCLAESKGKKEMRAIGVTTLEGVLVMEQVMPTDAIDKEYARGFLEDPSGACGFSRDGIVDLDEDQLKK